MPADLIRSLVAVLTFTVVVLPMGESIPSGSPTVYQPASLTTSTTDADRYDLALGGVADLHAEEGNRLRRAVSSTGRAADF